MKTEFILIILEFFGIFMVLGGISMIAIAIAGLHKRIKEFKMDDVKETTPDKVDDLEIAEYVKDQFIKQFPELIFSLGCSFNTTERTILWSMNQKNPYDLTLFIGSYNLRIKMDPSTYQFTFIKEGLDASFASKSSPIIETKKP